VRPIDRSTDHPNGRSYFLLRGQLVPVQHSLLQCGTISCDAYSIVQGRRLPRIDIDFQIVAHRVVHCLHNIKRPYSPTGYLSRLLRRKAPSGRVRSAQRAQLRPRVRSAVLRRRTIRVIKQGPRDPLTCGEVVALRDRLYVGCIKNGFAGASCFIDHNVVQVAFSTGLGEVLLDEAHKRPSPYLSAAEHLDVAGPLLLQRPPLMKRSCRVIADRGR